MAHCPKVPLLLEVAEQIVRFAHAGNYLANDRL